MRPFALIASVCLSVGAHGALGQRAPVRDGQHDFDFEIGTWKTHLRRNHQLAFPRT